MDTTVIYEKLVEKRRREIPDGYIENHHIFPKCLGGLDIPENLVKLTAREHFIAHLLLVKIYPDNDKLIHAAFRMSNRKSNGSRKYAWLKEKFSMLQSKKMKGKIPSPETVEKRRISNTGKKRSFETIEKMRISQSLRSPETIEKQRISQKGKSVSSETIEKLRISATGKHRSPEAREKIRTAVKAMWADPEKRKNRIIAQNAGRR